MEFAQTSSYGHSHLISSQTSLHVPSSLSTSNPVPLEQRRNPRRSCGNGLQKPPTLVRQDERKASFVDSLVDSATQMVEVIWPLSVTPCRPQTSGVLSLRRYIEETLRRSRTSYSTLQVALYYLVLIMPCVPKSDFTTQQSVDSSSVRALQCGRRMFLAALILASKYLQDRNYSAKAWSKMSGLKVAEINLNERAFLEAVNWKLHIPDATFKRWTDVVLRYTPSQFPPPPGQSFSTLEQKACWKTVIPLLTPDLEQVAPQTVQSAVCARPLSPPVAAYSALPSFLEPQTEVVPPTPAFVGTVGYLPTPRLTPPPVHTPAASVASFESSRSVGKLSRRSSFALSEGSTVLSPLSMISEASRLSRASSVSSVSTGSSSQNKMVPYQAQMKSEVVDVASSLMSMNTHYSQTVYDAQPCTASRPVKRSRANSLDESEEDEPVLQTRVRSLLQKEGTYYAPIVLTDDECAGTAAAADSARLHEMVKYVGRNQGEASKRRRVRYGEKSLSEGSAY